jgi:hypothetical protein
MDDDQKPYLSRQQTIIYHTIEQKKSACTSYTWNEGFCTNFSLTIPYTRHIKNKDIKEILDQEIKELDESYQTSLKDLDYATDELNLDGNDTGHFNWDKSIELFALTPSTITTKFDEFRYTNGRHGSYGVYFTNYHTKSHKKLKLKDIIKKESYAKFLKIAQNTYRKTYNMPQDVNMQYNGWFEKDFFLTDNFAITAKGLYFLYNTYDIKAYADGQTPFTISYKDIKPLLNPTYFPSDFFDKLHMQNLTIKRAFNRALMVDISPLDDKTLSFKITAQNRLYSVRKGWLSITFKGLDDIRLTQLKSDFERFDKYPNGTPIYHKPTKKSIRKHSVLLEAYDANWSDESNTTRSLSFIIKKPKNHSKLTVFFRLLLKNKEQDSIYKHIIIYPSEDNTVGEQGYQNYKVEIDFD